MFRSSIRSTVGIVANAATSTTIHAASAEAPAMNARSAEVRCRHESASSTKAASGTTPRYRSSSETCQSSHFATLATE